MDNIHCMGCRSKTANHKAQLAKTSNGRPMILAECGQCGRRKTKFMSKAEFQAGQRGEGLISGLLGFKDGFPGINQIPIIGQLL